MGGTRQSGTTKTGILKLGDTEASRTSPVGLFHHAHSYSVSAATLTKSGIRVTHPEAPIRFLYTHAIELYLKSFLMVKGISLARLRSRALGHDLCALFREAVNLGLVPDRPMESEISSLNDAIRDRYIETGVRHILPIQALHSLCESLNRQVGPIIYSIAKITRSPASLPTL